VVSTMILIAPPRSHIILSPRCGDRVSILILKGLASSGYFSSTVFSSIIDKFTQRIAIPPSSLSSQL